MTSTARARAAVDAALSAPATPEPEPAPVIEIHRAPSGGAEVVQLGARGLPATRSTSMPEKIQYAQALARASLLPKAYQQNPGNVLLAVEMGEALGLHTYIAITNFHVIEGKPSASAGLISALVRRAGHRLRITGNDTKATVQIVRADDPDFTYEAVWTIDRAKTAGLLSKDVWKKYPAAMLKSRAITEGARDACQEALMGIDYTPEELGADVDVDGEPVTYTIQQGEPVPADDSWSTAIANASTVDDCRAVYKSCFEAGAMTDELATAIAERAAALTGVEDANVVTGEVVEPTDADFAAMNAEADAQAQS